MTLQICLGLYGLDTLKGGCSVPGRPSSYRFLSSCSVPNDHFLVTGVLFCPWFLVALNLPGMGSFLRVVVCVHVDMVLSVGWGLGI